MEDVPFQSVEEFSERLRGHQYVAKPSTVAALFVALRLARPVLLEGPPGAGKTELANALAKALETSLIKLQCYEGISTDQAIGRFDQQLQNVYLWMHHQQSGQVPAPGQLAAMVYTPDFLIKGPILQAILWPRRAVLVVDEVDKVGPEFEAVLYEVLNDWTVSLPEMNRPVEAISKPIVILTSNGARELTEPLLRRCIYLWLDYPTPKEEVEILGLRASTPDVALDTQIAGHAVALRNNLLEKPPSVSEMLMLREALTALGIHEMGPEHRDLVVPYVLKKKRDLDTVMKRDHAFESVLADTNRCRDTLAEMRAAEEWQRMRASHQKVFDSKVAAYEKTLAELKQRPSWTKTAEPTRPAGLDAADNGKVN